MIRMIRIADWRGLLCVFVQRAAVLFLLSSSEMLLIDELLLKFLNKKAENS